MKFMLSLVIIPLSYAFNVNTSAPKQSYYFTYIGGPFPKDVYNAWSGTYPLVSITRGVRIKVEYKVLSSGEGKHALIKKQSSFAATETGLITNDEIREGEGKLRVFPVAAGSVFFLINYKVTIGYNIPGFQSLILNREILVGIFNGTINEWGHSDILALNPSLRTVLNGHSPAITIIKRREEIRFHDLFTIAEPLVSFQEHYHLSLLNGILNTAHFHLQVDGRG
jgi:ABC-type phosphate transport system substrate-binding protein